MSRIRSLFLYTFLCFGTGLLACILQFNLSNGRGETNLALVFDSGHYLQTSNLIVEALQKQNLSPQLLPALSLDGPVLPGLGALALILGNFVALKDWQSLLALQFILHAFGAALVFLLGRQIFAGNNKWALAAGLAWAINPVAVLAGQRFLSEILATDLLLFFVLLCCALVSRSQLDQSAKSDQHAQNVQFQIILSLAAGFCAALIAFAKTALLPVIALLLVLLLVQFARRSVKSLGIVILPFLLAACLLIVSWAGFTHALSGRAQFFTERAPVLNLFVGWNFSNEGFSTLPVAPPPEVLQKEYERSHSAPQAVLKLWSEQPAASAALTLRKIARLYSNPWNDFRRNALFLSPRLQQYLHLATIFLALLAVCVASVRGAPTALWYSAVMVVGHFVFLLFETIPRYAFSSYPFLLLLALAFLSWLPLKIAQVDRNKIGYRLACVLMAVGVVVGFNWRRQPGRNEGQLKLAGGAIAERVFDLHLASDFHVKPGFAMILIDGVRQIGNSELSINGTRLQERPVNLYKLMPDREEHYRFAEQVCSFMGRSTDDIRHWWAVPVPVALLNAEGENKIALMAHPGSDARLFADRPLLHPARGNERPGYLYISPGMIWSTNDSFEWRQGEAFTDQGLIGKSYSVDSAGRRTEVTGNWRLILVISNNVDIARQLESGVNFRDY